MGQARLLYPLRSRLVNLRTNDPWHRLQQSPRGRHPCDQKTIVSSSLKLSCDRDGRIHSVRPRVTVAPKSPSTRGHSSALKRRSLTLFAPSPTSNAWPVVGKDSLGKRAPDERCDASKAVKPSGTVMAVLPAAEDTTRSSFSRTLVLGCYFVYPASLRSKTVDIDCNPQGDRIGDIGPWGALACQS